MLQLLQGLLSYTLLLDMPDVQVKTECLIACREMTIDSAYKVRCRTDARSCFRAAGPRANHKVRSDNRAARDMSITRCARWCLCL